MSEPYKHPHLGSNNSLRHACEEYAREQWGPLLTQANENAAYHKKEMHRVLQRNEERERDAEAGRAFKKLMKELRVNPAAQQYWDKFLMVLKLSDRKDGD